MGVPVTATVSSDYLWSYWYNAAGRSARLKREYGGRLALRWKSSALVPGADPRRTFNAHAAEAQAKARASTQAEGVMLLEWTPGATPESRLPALVAAKCAAGPAG